MNKTSKRILILVTLILLLILYILNANLITEEFINYTNIFFTKLFPVTFIFFTMSSLLLDYGIIEIFIKSLKINASPFYIILMSMISGFPSGSKYTKDLYQKNLITKESASKLLMYTHFPNPLFILSTVNIIINDTNITIKILLSIILSNFILLILNPPKNNKTFQNNYIPPKNFATSLSNSIFNTFKTIVIIYGNSIFFFLIATIINKYLFLNTHNYILLNGFFDITKGITSTTIISNKLNQALYIITFISFGGISIHMQVKSILADTSLIYKHFLVGRIFGTIISIIIFLLLNNITYFHQQILENNLLEQLYQLHI